MHKFGQGAMCDDLSRIYISSSDHKKTRLFFLGGGGGRGRKTLSVNVTFLRSFGDFCLGLGVAVKNAQGKVLPAKKIDSKTWLSNDGKSTMLHCTPGAV